MRSRWGAALRIARRDAARHRGRSLLVVVLVGLPVLLSVGLATTWATLDITPAEDVDRELGQAAAAVTTYAFGEEGQDPLAGAAGTAEALGARVVRLTSSYQRFATGARSTERPVDGELLSVDLDDPVTDGIVGLRDGRLPRAVDEAVVSPAMARAGAEPGDRVDAAGRTLRVVGVVDVAERIGTREVVVTLPGAVPRADVGGATTTLLLDRDAPVGRAEVDALAGDSSRVLSRELLTAQGVGWSDESDVGDGSAEDRALTALVIACIVIEVALLAGPAFAVGVRAQRRQLALLAAGGGAPGDLVRTVLSGALVLGGLASAAGAVLGIVLTPVVTTALRWAVGVRVGPLEPAWGPAVAAAALGLLAAVLAAVVPARQAARRDLVAALGDRPDTPRPAWGWPLLGAALTVVGLLMVLASATRAVPEIVVAFGTVVMVLGAVLIVPLLVGGIGRLADRLPLSLRLAARDTARQRARSAPAIAAVMAIVAGISALAIGSASDFAQDRRDYLPQAAPGQAVVYLAQGPGLDDVVDGLGAALPEHPVLPVRSVWTGDAMGGDPWTVQRPGCDPTVGPDGTDCTLTYSTVLSGAWSAVTVATADDAEALGIDLRAQDVQALEEGRALVASSGAVRDGRVTIGTGDRQVEVPAAGAALRWRGSGSDVAVAQVLVPPATAERLDLPVTTSMAVTDARSGAVTEAQAAAAEQAQTVAGVAPSETYVYVERGFTRSFTVPLLLLIGAGGLLVLLGTATATGLALVDARPDLATLSAVGAPPAVRRRIAAASALVVGLVGAVLGALLGVVPGLAAATFLTRSSGLDPTPVYVVPWEVLGFVVVVVPLVGALLCAAAVRSRTVLTRRAS